MMDKNSQTEQVEIIKNQIDQALKEIEKIKNQTSTIRNAADLEQFEKTISKATDKLAGLLTAKMIQESLDSDDMNQQSSELVKNLPQHMKNQGQRDVTIVPSRGKPVTIKTTYYSKNKKRKRRKKKR